MAIYIDGIQLVPKKDGTSMEQKYYQDREELKELFARFKKGDQPSILIFKREWAKKWNNMGTSYKPAPPAAVPLRASYYDADGAGAIDIRYSASPPEKLNGRLRWNKGMELVYEMYSIREDQIDLAWFMLKASNVFEKGSIKLVDAGVEIEAKFDTMVLQADVANGLKAITEDELAQVYVHFNGGKFNYQVNDSVKVNAMRLWDIAIMNAKEGNHIPMEDLKVALDKVKPTEDLANQTVLVDDVEYPLLPLPEGWDKAKILKVAIDNGIELTKKPTKLAVLYTMLQAKMEKKEPAVY